MAPGEPTWAPPAFGYDRRGCVVFRVFAVVLLCLGAGGCAEPRSVAATESAIEGIPVPETAKPYPMPPSGREDYVADAYWAVDMSFDELDAWYEQHMPKGTPWRGWTWHEPLEARMSIQRSYCQAGRAGISVIITREEGGNPPGILVSQDGSGSGC